MPLPLLTFTVERCTFELEEGSWCASHDRYGKIEALKKIESACYIVLLSLLSLTGFYSLSHRNCLFSAKVGFRIALIPWAILITTFILFYAHKAIEECRCQYEKRKKIKPAMAS